MTVRHWKETAAIVIGLSLSCIFSEIAARIYFALDIGPRVLLYGTDWYRNVERGEGERRPWLTENELVVAGQESARKDSVEHHGLELVDYNKFFPRENKSTKDVDTGDRISVTINENGFRGNDFKKNKSHGVIRILTLGASSTFGFYSIEAR